MLPSRRHLILIPFRTVSPAAFDGKTEFAWFSTGKERNSLRRRRRRRRLLVYRNRSLPDRRGCTTKYAKHLATHRYLYLYVGKVPVRDIVYLKCGRRSRLLPIHLAQDGRQIELPPETQDQRTLAACLSFLPSSRSSAPRFLLSHPLSHSLPISHPSAPSLRRSPSPHPRYARRGYWLLSLLFGRPI
jgi:hypothetical protein